MADQMLRIAGRGDDGTAKAINTTNDGIIKMKVTDTVNENRRTQLYSLGSLQSLSNGQVFETPIIDCTKHDVVHLAFTGSSTATFQVRVLNYNGTTYMGSAFREDIATGVTSGTLIKNFNPTFPNVKFQIIALEDGVSFNLIVIGGVSNG